jgi:hypothetical protein
LNCEQAAHAGDVVALERQVKPALPDGRVSVGVLLVPAKSRAPHRAKKKIE